ncbi:hypothetical protein GJ744_001460 [Endocarpon pusillum]|uniref:Uncharacterized protein n=1 Tax=Endocarpon pusillum TaxID=364733 RepID=A0A8H7AWQ7_9EURO|nr:hypothetical protein GJ744_001460 [Endocarpon pusillum]
MLGSEVGIAPTQDLYEGTTVGNMLGIHVIDHAAQASENMSEKPFSSVLRLAYWRYEEG